MNQPDAKVILALEIVAVMQMLLALVNFALVRLMGWKADLARLSLLPREVFQVHVWFISLTLMLFGVLTWRFAEVTARGVNDLALWLAAGIGLFWATRAVVQVCYYSAEHWRGRTGRTIGHILCIIVYGGWALVYLGAVATG